MEHSDFVNVDNLLWHVELIEDDGQARQRARRVRRLLKTSPAWSAYLREFGPTGGGVAIVKVSGLHGLLRFTPIGF